MNDGNVELMGDVNQPYQEGRPRPSGARRAGRAQRNDDLKVLPLSTFDDQLRLQVARAIYRDPVLSATVSRQCLRSTSSWRTGA